MRYPVEAWYEAANFRDGKSVKEMLRDVEPEELNFLDKNGESPLIASVKSDYYFAVNLLLSAGADPSLKDEEGKNALHHAMENDVSEDIIDLLISAGAEIGEFSQDEVEAELEDKGFEEASDSYLVEATLSRHLEEAYTNSVSNDKVTLCETRTDTSGNMVLHYRVPGARTFKEAAEKVSGVLGEVGTEEEEEMQSNVTFLIVGSSVDFGYTLFEAIGFVEIPKEFEAEVVDIGEDSGVKLVVVFDPDEDSAIDWLESATGGEVIGESSLKTKVFADPELDVEDFDGEVEVFEEGLKFAISAKIRPIMESDMRSFRVSAYDENTLKDFLAKAKQVFPESVHRADVVSAFKEQRVRFDFSNSVYPDSVVLMKGE